MWGDVDVLRADVKYENYDIFCTCTCIDVIDNRSIRVAAPRDLIMLLFRDKSVHPLQSIVMLVLTIDCFISFLLVYSL